MTCLILTFYFLLLNIKFAYFKFSFKIFPTSCDGQEKGFEISNEMQKLTPK